MNVFEVIIGRLERGPLLWTLLFLAVAMIGLFLFLSSALVEDLAVQERSRMQIWADATKEIAESAGDDNVDFPLSIIEDNRNIPIVLVDSAGRIMMHRNFELPQSGPGQSPSYADAANQAFLLDKVNAMKTSGHCIDIEIAPGNIQHLYYEDSSLLRRLNLFPYLQLLVMIAFVVLVYFVVSASRRAEQNKVWVGLSKETAHQLGTPISSLMAWIEVLGDSGCDSVVVDEMNKDISRLSVIASRFSKIGSMPHMAAADVGSIVRRSVDYMSTRISPKVDLSVDLPSKWACAVVSEPLLEWVMENLMKNAVDAMSGCGCLSVSCKVERQRVVAIEVADTGKGMPRKLHRKVFKAGFTTKSRGWGLGLTLAKRIIEEYHGGRIYVKRSEPGHGTTFRIELEALECKENKS